MTVSYQALLVLRTFLLHPDPQCGAEIMRGLGLGAGTVYPLLKRLRRAGWLEHAGTLPAPNEPPAHFYRLTAAGRAMFLSQLARLTIPGDLWRTPS